MREVAIVSATRTAIGGFLGGLSTVRATRLGTIVVAEALRRANVELDEVEKVYMGNVLQAGLGQNPARQAALNAGIPYKVSAFTINKVCGSGLAAVVFGVQSIMLGDCDIVVAGGMENMSAAPFLVEKGRTGYRMGDGTLVDSMVRDGLWEIYNDYHMGITAENLAEKYGISRKEQDAFAVKSQQRCREAIAAERFEEEIVPVEVPRQESDSIIFDKDEFPKPDTTVEILATLKPAFRKGGTVTAGNAAGVNDGAAAVVLMPIDVARKRGLTPLAVVCSYADRGVDPAIMGIAPAYASQEALTKAGLSLSDMDVVEMTEAFAAQWLAVGKELNWDEDKVNVNGGAIALGHPIGMSGARILVTLLYEMKRRNSRHGLAALCIGGGEGIAVVVHRS